MIKELLDKSLTQYHACDEVARILTENGFGELKENEKWNVARGKGYFVRRDGSAIIAFRVGERNSFNIVASHTDSPCFKLKFNPEIKTDNYFKFNVEKYGGGIFYTWLDRPLKVAGRIVLKDGDGLHAVTFTSRSTFVIPSVAIHFNRTVNDGVKLNAQTDMSPIESILREGGLAEEIARFAGDKTVCDGDLYLVCAQPAFSTGCDGELLCSPRIDNLTSVFSSVYALIAAHPEAIDVCYAADNEEVGSSTKQGAGSKFLFDTLTRIARSLGIGEEDYAAALADSFMVSDDNAHAVHPNHPELSDPTNRVMLGKGIVIKHHANRNYTSDAFSSSLIKTVFDKAEVKHQDFFMRSDLPCGGTLGAISSRQVSIRSVDIGLAQLAMHSAVETFAVADYDEAVKGLTSFFSCAFASSGGSDVKII